MEEEIDRMLSAMDRPSAFYVHRKSLLAISAFVLGLNTVIDYLGILQGTFAEPVLMLVYVFSSMMILVTTMFIVESQNRKEESR